MWLHPNTKHPFNTYLKVLSSTVHFNCNLINFHIVYNLWWFLCFQWFCFIFTHANQTISFFVVVFIWTIFPANCLAAQEVKTETINLRNRWEFSIMWWNTENISNFSFDSISDDRSFSIPFSFSLYSYFLFIYVNFRDFYIFFFLISSCSASFHLLSFHILTIFIDGMRDSILMHWLIEDEVVSDECCQIWKPRTD